MEFVYLIVAFIIVTIILIWLFKARDRENNIFLDTTAPENKAFSNIGETLSDRNQAIIQNYLGQISGYNRSNYIEDKVYDCIDEIVLKEGRADLSFESQETLSEWHERADIPSEYLELENNLRTLFSKQHSDILKRNRKRWELGEPKREQNRLKRHRKEVREKQQDLYNRNKDLIANFLQIAERKISVIDDYGDENWEALPPEIDVCLKKISQRENDQIDWQYYKKFNSGLPEEYEGLKSELNTAFLEYHAKAAIRDASTTDVHKMTGVEFETWVAKILKENGFQNVRGTPAIGDQGADIIVEKNGRNIIIQVKRHKGTVGNKAVQEVISAIQYYGGDEGWVITNSTFTPSAKALAQKSNIKLIDGKALSLIKDYIN